MNTFLIFVFLAVYENDQGRKGWGITWAILAGMMAIILIAREVLDA